MFKLGKGIPVKISEEMVKDDRPRERAGENYRHSESSDISLAFVDS